MVSQRKRVFEVLLLRWHFFLIALFIALIVANDAVALRGALSKMAAKASPVAASAYVQGQVYSRLAKVFRPLLDFKL